MKRGNNFNEHSKELNDMINHPMDFCTRWGILIVFLLSLLFSLVVVTVNAQSLTTIRGCVMTDNNVPVVGINVFVAQLNQRYKILGSNITDSKGLFTLSFQCQADSVSLFCSGMTISRTQENVANRDAFHHIYVEEKTQKLKEVTVKARKIYMGGDTINYNVASFLSKNDQSIGDVLKKLPGITVSDAGKISYKGMPIKNFYIEGLDLMKGRYGLATNNVDPNSISTVQVLENHQDVKALKNLCPEERASINLKLKEGVKGVFNLIATVGGGHDGNDLWMSEAVATYFKKKSQLLATYKGNNAGTDLEAELRSFDSDDYERTSNLTNLEMPTAPGLAKRYYYFNKSNSVTLNNIYRIGKSANMGINFGALADRDARNSSSTIKNLLPDETYNTINESLSAVMKKKSAYGNISFIDNSEGYYVKNVLSLDYNEMQGASNVINEKNLVQNSKARVYRLHNELHLTSKMGHEKGIDFVSKQNIERRPHSLLVDTNLFPDILESDEMTQWVECKSMEFKNQLSFMSSWVVGKLQLSPTIYCDFRQDRLNSILSQYENELALNKLNAGLGMYASYKVGKLYFDLDMPVGYRRNQLKDYKTQTALLQSRFNVEPSLGVDCRLTSSHSLRYRIALTNDVPSIENLYGQYMLNSYRQMSYYKDQTLYQGLWLTNKLSYNYKNIFKMFFVDATLFWNRNKPHVLYGSRFDGLAEIMESVPAESVADLKGIKLNVSKGFDWKKSKVGLVCDYSRTDSPMLLQGEEIGYVDNQLSLRLDVSATLCEWLALSHTSSCYTISSKINHGISAMSLLSMNNDTSVDFFLPAGILVSTSFSHYYNSMNEKDKSFLLCEASARYTHKKWMFTLLCNNLFNKKNYNRSSSSSLKETIASYNIRQRGVMLKVRYRIF